MELTEYDKKVLAELITYYYNNYIWGTLYRKDTNMASDKDHEVRNIIRTLDLEIPHEIRARF